jgi:hypothetical protein
MTKSLVIILVLSSLLLAACSSAAPVEPTQAPIAPTPDAQAYPYPYPAPQKYIPPTPRSYPEPGMGQITAAPFVLPEPNAETGVVTGVLYNVNTGEPLAFQTLYLATKIMLTPGPGYTYGITEKASPHTTTGADGRFAMGNVKPGRYIVMIFTPHKSSVVMQPNTDLELEVVVEAGGTLDLGDIKGLNPME